MKKTVRILVATIAALALMAGTAVATHVFDDVPDGEFYAVPAEWAKDNGISLGCGGNNFCPLDDVTRGENITFAYRYDQNIVQPSLGVVAMATSPDVDGWDGTEERTSINFMAPQDGFVLVTYVASAGHDGDDPAVSNTTDGRARVEVNGTAGGFVRASWINSDPNDDSHTDDAAITVTHVAPVVAGSNTIQGIIQADRPSYLYQQTLTALFVPNGQN